MFGDQLAGELWPDDERRGLVLSISKELEPGARAMLLLASGLFRLDVAISPDTMRTVVRNLSSGELEIKSHSGYGQPGSLASIETVAYRPSSSGLSFALGRDDDRVTVDVLIGLLRFLHRGTVRVTAQARIRQI
jgi:hypothetical protein